MKNSQKYIIMVAGGTGGHIYPAVVLAEELISVGYNVIFFINNNLISKEILKISNFKYITFDIINIPKKFSLLFVLFFIKLTFVFLKSLKQMLILKPLAIIGTGGCISVPVVVAAKILKKTIFIHEQNAIPGKANIFLSKISDRIFLSFSCSKEYFKNKNVFIFGYPIRKNILMTSKKQSIKKLNLKKRIFTILVFGGSLGSFNFNKIICETLLDLIYKNVKIQILHISGFNDYIFIKKQIRGFENSNYKLFRYMHNISYAYAASDIVICRAGAGTVFELLALNKSAILVPYSYATDNHQYWNAKQIEKNNKIIIINEKDLNKKHLSEIIYMFKKKNINKKISKNTFIYPQKLILNDIKKYIRY
ncbi:MAG: UDP-N-acetylglucosamine--N-acetylmuramyl-(pentapeptide) pyrophosphoryl-undecaprenol N-acetylglucosamine transferase [Endomicrobium sp.]|jgi:UDP-N-acetylglucosamine--N-acetylmuramyl-(pentapeptide) pyrophosphoryl-undecaprenol N-acetylglucosamine transferase|nr:UDP-N-acetylglucosamine--N-acetylmuramyl-(pentapeptide) pyrophosphoryl-undecaprenol N-acetylglucosamine transferase [Endomicrobium sp.]